jgi:hypothetical protein
VHPLEEKIGFISIQRRRRYITNKLSIESPILPLFLDSILDQYMPCTFEIQPYRPYKENHAHISINYFELSSTIKYVVDVLLMSTYATTHITFYALYI